MKKVKIIASDKAKHLKAGETYEVTQELAEIFKKNGYVKQTRKKKED